MMMDALIFFIRLLLHHDVFVTAIIYAWSEEKQNIRRTKANGSI